MRTRLRRPVVAWLVWLVVAYGLFAVAAWTSPSPWKIGAYSTAIDIMDAHWWSAVWGTVAASAAAALVCRCAPAARFALVVSIAVQLPWAYSVLVQGFRLGEPWAFVPAALVWLAPAAASAAMLTQGLHDHLRELGR
jgi:hypothetical protein